MDSASTSSCSRVTSSATAVVEPPQPTHRHWAKRWPNVIASIGERLQYNVGLKLKWNTGPTFGQRRWPNVQELYQYSTLFQRCFNHVTMFLWYMCLILPPFWGTQPPPFPFLSFPWPPPSPVSMPFPSIIAFACSLALSHCELTPKMQLTPRGSLTSGQRWTNVSDPLKNSSLRWVICLLWHRLKAYIFHKSFPF